MALPWRRLVALCLLASGTAHAGPAEDFAAADISGRVEILQQWASKPDPARLPLIEAIGNGELHVDAQGHAFLTDGSTVRDADTGKTVSVDPNSLDKVVVNNRVRSVLATTLASLQLASPDPKVWQASLSTLENASDPALAPAVEARLKGEKDPAIQAQLQRIRANLLLASTDPAQRKAAVEALGNSNDPATQAKLQAVVQSEADAGVKQAAQQSLSAVERRLFTQTLFGHLFTGLSLGSVLLLAALGLAITYGLLGVINMAHGEMLMLGAYTTYAVQQVFRQWLPGAVDWYLPAALPAAFVVCGLVGIALERLVIRHLYGRALETLLATWGISLMLIQAVRMGFGAQNVEVANPSWLSGGWQVAPALTLPYARLAILAFSVAVLAFTWLLLTRTRLGLFMRAVTQNRRMAGCVGVSTDKVDMLAFGLGSGIAGLGGVALSQIGNVGPDLGQAYVIDAFMVVVLGGVGQLAGAVMGAFGLGLVAKLLEPTVGAVLGKIAILMALILFIQKRPQGLFALKGRAVD